MNSGGRELRGAELPQESRSHDLKLQYREDKIEVSVVLFYTEIDNLINFLNFNTSQYRIFHYNVGDVVSKGIELDLKRKLSHGVTLYGNYIYSDAHFTSFNISNYTGDELISTEDRNFIADDKSPTGVPAHIWNLGLEWQMNDEFYSNIHYRAWADSQAKTGPTSYKTFGSEHYFDLSLNYRTETIITTLYVKNILNNTNFLPIGANGGASDGYGRHAGITFTYSF